MARPLAVGHFIGVLLVPCLLHIIYHKRDDWNKANLSLAILVVERHREWSGTRFSLEQQKRLVEKV